MICKSIFKMKFCHSLIFFIGQRFYDLFLYFQPLFDVVHIQKPFKPIYINYKRTSFCYTKILLLFPDDFKIFKYSKAAKTLSFKSRIGIFGYVFLS